MYLLFFTHYWFVVPLLVCPYALWLYYDRKTPRGRSRPCHYFQTMRLGRFAAQYFPLRLVKTVELNRGRNYVMGYHPHGVVPIGYATTLGTNACDVFEKFPGFKFRLTTVPITLHAPFVREYMLAMGFIDSRAESIEYALNNSPAGGTVVVLAVGGSREALEAQPGKYKLILRNRKGFVRLAMKTGSDLVPCISFGENDIYRQLETRPGSWIRSVQELFQKIFAIPLPFFYGYGFVPFSRPVTVVGKDDSYITEGPTQILTTAASRPSAVGKPLSVERVPDPTEQQILSVHQKYIESLTTLFEENKSLYASADAKLEII